jgi:hypothetical protein
MSNKITQLDLVGQSFPSCKSYIHSSTIIDLATDKFEKTGKGITYKDLMDAGIVIHKRHAQDILKYHLRKGDIFTLKDKRPQQYYPTGIRAEVIEKIAKNTPIDPTGVGILSTSHSSSSPSKSPLCQCFQYTSIHTLEGYVLPLLPDAPLFIHNMHFKTKILPECYSELELPSYKRNKGEYHTEIIGKARVDYVLYASGTVDIQSSCSNNPYKLETEEDRFRIIEFFGQIRAGLINLLNDKHERIVDDVLEWELTECDINRDIKVSDLLHFSAIKVQVKHLDHLFSIYIKSMGTDTVCRIEERKRPNQSAIEFINDVFNPVERVEKHLAEIGRKIDRICSVNNIDGSSKDLVATTTAVTTNNSSDVRCQQV